MSDTRSVERWHAAARLGDIPLREGRRVRYQDYDIALFNLGDRYLAVDNRCPHRQGPLADGIVAGAAVFCPLHSWKISLDTGCALAGGEGSVAHYPVKVIGDRVCIAFHQGTRSAASAPPVPATEANS